MALSELKGKRALVTAGAAGIGKAIVEALLGQGVRVAVGQRNVAKLEPLLKKYGSKGNHATAGHAPQLVGFPVDTSRSAECKRLVRDAVAALGGLDILINNAAVTGVPAASWFLKETAEHVDAIVDTNLKGVIHCSIAAARQMVEQKQGGVIIHISSVGAFGGQQAGSVYCATKAALTGLTQTMALELAQHRIRVIAVAPGDIRVETAAMVRDQLQTMQVDPRFIPQTPWGAGAPEDIGSVVAFLASDQAKFVTGVTWVVDGGLLAY